MLSLSQLFLHPQNCPFMELEGNWTDDDRYKLINILVKLVDYHILTNPPPYFNYWIFLKYGNWIVAKRLTWEGFRVGGNWEKLEKDLIKEYSYRKEIKTNDKKQK